jgi:transposase
MVNQEQLVDIHVRHQQGQSIRKIAKDTGLSRNTIRRYLRKPNLVPCYTARPEQPSVLEPFKPYLLERINAAYPDWIPATVLLREIKERGYSGGYSTLTNFLRLHKPKPKPDPLIRYETEPGVQMQVDFTTISYRGKRIKAFVATLGFSRGSFVKFSCREKQEDWLQGIEEAFEYFGGVTKEVLFDNAKAIMIERDAYGKGTHKWNSALLELAKRYGFKPRACRPYRAKTKGKVERFNAYLKGSFVTPLIAELKQHKLEFTVDIANARIGPWLTNIAHQRIHGTTGEQPQALMEKELEYLMSLPIQVVKPVVRPMTCEAVPVESFQHPLAVYDSLLEVRV